MNIVFIFREENMTIKIDKTVEAKHFTKPFVELLNNFPSLDKHLISQNPPKFDLGDSNVLSLLNGCLFQDMLELKIDVPEKYLIPALGIRYSYCDIVCQESSNGTLIEIGTGASAAIAMILAKKYRKEVLATEINPISFQSAKENIKRNNLSNLITLIKSEGQVLNEIIPTGDYSFLLCYPPIYDFDQTKLWKKRGWKGTHTEIFGGGKDGLGFVRRLISEVINSENVRVENLTIMLMNKKQVEAILRTLPTDSKTKIIQIMAGTRNRYILIIRNK